MSSAIAKKKTTFPKLENLLHEAIRKISADGSTLIGKRVNFEDYSCDISSIYNYISENDINYMLVMAEVEEGYKGYVCMLFAVKEAATLGGLLLAMDEQQIMEKVRENVLDEEYTDAFKEFGSQICGVLDGVFRNHLPKAIHIKQTENTPFNLQNAETVAPEILKDESVLLTSHMEIAGFGPGRFSMFIPKALSESFFEESIEMEEGGEKVYAGVVLVVNPVTSEVKSARKCLGKGKYKVLVAKDSISAIATLQKEKVDIILMDMELPKDNGIVVSGRIRRNLLTEDIPIIMCSASPTQQQVIDSIKAGVQDFIVKPLDEEILLGKIQRNILKRAAVSVFN